MAKAKTFDLVITSAVVIDGEIVKPKQKVSVPEKLARNLLDRGNAELAKGAEAPKKGTGPIGTDGDGGAKRQGKEPADEGGEK